MKSKSATSSRLAITLLLHSSSASPLRRKKSFHRQLSRSSSVPVPRRAKSSFRKACRSLLALDEYIGLHGRPGLFGDGVLVAAAFVANHDVGGARAGVVGRHRIGVAVERGVVDRGGVTEVFMASALGCVRYTVGTERHIEEHIEFAIWFQ